MCRLREIPAGGIFACREAVVGATALGRRVRTLTPCFILKSICNKEEWQVLRKDVIMWKAYVLGEAESLRMDSGRFCNE